MNKMRTNYKEVVQLNSEDEVEIKDNQGIAQRVNTYFGSVFRKYDLVDPRGC